MVIMTKLAASSRSVLMRRENDPAVLPVGITLVKGRRSCTMGWYRVMRRASAILAESQTRRVLESAGPASAPSA